MKLTTAVQECLLALLCYDSSPGTSGHILSLVPVSYYDPFYREVAEMASDYVRKFRTPPGEHTLDLINSLKERNPDSSTIYEDIFQSLQETSEGVNKDYTLSQASVFFRHQKLKRAMSGAIEAAERNNEEGVTEAENILRDCLKGTVDTFDPGVFLTDTANSLNFLDPNQYEVFPTGIRQIDERGLGPARKQLHLFIALPGYGKTWWLIHLAKQALVAKKKVLFITLELSRDIICQRFMQALFSLGKRDTRHRFQSFETDDVGKFVSSSPEKLKRLALMDNEHESRKYLERELSKLKRKRKPLLVKEFPGGSLTIADLEGFLDGLELNNNFIPDLLIIDYADRMWIDPKNYRTSVGQTYTLLRGIGQKRNISIATASQANRVSVKKGEGVITGANVAEDYSKIHTVDVAITHNQTQTEHEMGLARLFVAKGRGDVDRFTVLISQAYSLGQFCMASAGMNKKKYWKIMKEEL
jgi:replicative DNA helicase